MSNHTSGFVGENRPGPVPGLSERTVDVVFSLVYEELRRYASYVRKREVSTTLNSTALVHEAWLKVKDSPDLASMAPAHFKAIAARAMRQVLVDRARRRHTHKRGGSGDIVFIALDEAAGEPRSSDRELLAVDAALAELAQLNPRQAEMIQCRFFGGLSVLETAAWLGVSESVVERDWRAAKAWLAVRIRQELG